MKNLYGTRIPSPRQRQCISLIAEGLTNKEIAKVMGITVHGVKDHLAVIYDKLGLWNRVEVALWYLKTTSCARYGSSVQ